MPFLTFPPTYDGVNGNLYAPGTSDPAANGTVSIISGATNERVATARVGWEPELATVDPVTGDVYVPNLAPAGCVNCAPGSYQGQPNVTVVSGTTNTVIAGLPTPPSPMSIAYDPANGDLYVADDTVNLDGNGSLTVISGTTNQVVETVQVAAFPTNVFYNAANGDLYVMDQAPAFGVAEIPDQLTVISSSTNTIVGTIPLLGDTSGLMLFDPVNGDWYAGGGGGVIVISGDTNQEIQTLSLPWVTSGFVSTGGDVYLLHAGLSATLSLISGSSNTIVSSFSVGDVSSMTYDPANGNLYTTNGGVDLNVTSLSSEKLIQSLDLGSSSHPGQGGWLRSQPVYDPGNGELYIVDEGSSTSILVVSTNVTPSAISAPSSTNPWAYLGAGVGLGAVAAAGATLLVLRTRAGRGGKSEPNPGRP
jgi:DNA-binding beta-propeller fold protein YncE